MVIKLDRLDKYYHTISAVCPYKNPSNPCWLSTLFIECNNLLNKTLLIIYNYDHSVITRIFPHRVKSPLTHDQRRFDKIHAPTRFWHQFYRQTPERYRSG